LGIVGNSLSETVISSDSELLLNNTVDKEIRKQYTDSSLYTQHSAG